MKKIGLFFGVLFALVLGSLIAIPFFVNVDQYRPQILEVANQRLNGKLDIGKLSISLWGQIRIGIDGLKLTDAAGREVLEVKDAYFHLPLSSVFSGSPKLTLKMNEPRVSMVKSKNGKINVLTLAKKTHEEKVAESMPSGTTVQDPTKVSQGSSSPEGKVALPALVTRARLGVELSHAQVKYKDELSGLSSDISDLNLVLRDISLSHPTELELWADLNTRLGELFILQGPARLTGKAVPEFKNGKFSQVHLKANLDMDSVQMTTPGVFEKKKGMATSVDLDLTASETEVVIAKLLARFFNLEVGVTGKVTQLSSDERSGVANPNLQLSITSNEIQLRPWTELVPMLKEYELGGTARFNSEVRGPAQKMNYNAQLSVSGLTAKSHKLKVQPKMDAEVSVIPDQVNKILIVMSAPGNELKATGKLVSFSQPKLEMNVTSNGMDLDQLVEFSSTKAQSGSKGEGAGSQAPTAPGSSQDKAIEDYDAMLNPLRENEMLRRFGARVSLDMKMMKARGVRVSDISCQLSFKDLSLGLNSCGLKVFSGVVKANTQMQFKPKTPTYQFDTQVSGLDLSQAVESSMALFKNTVTGKAQFKMKGDGASFNPDTAIMQLSAGGNLKVDQAEFTTIDVAKMVSDSLNKSLKELESKVPAVKGKSVTVPGHGSKYEFISSHFTIEKGKLSAPDFFAKAEPNRGLDIKGKTVVGLKDYSLDTTWDVIDTYNMTGLRDISVEVSGVKVEHVLAEGSAPVHFPIHAGCTIKAPCYSSTEIPSHFAKIAMLNMSQAAAARGKEELKKQAEKLLQQAPPALQDKLKGLFR